MKTLSAEDFSKNNERSTKRLALLNSDIIPTCKQKNVSELLGVMIKIQQPAVSGLRVESLTNQNSGLPWTRVNAIYMKGTNNVQQ
ncbi:MAG TPA: hypothetical protein VJ729_12665 [Nitrososphaeraceae archaeon]|nr:hypothetical protein [Nitrososphaeraceae archaeon]